ncbi:MAG: hypothetical protein ACK5WC_11735 [Aphanizomenon sp.]|jgi:hypothetical protein
MTITTLTKLDFLEFIEQHPIVDKDIVIRTVTNKGDQRGRNSDVSVVSASLWNSNVTLS